jgi:hypothetical protein
MMSLGFRKRLKNMNKKQSYALSHYLPEDKLYKTSLKISNALTKIQTSYFLNKCLVLPHYTSYLRQDN